MPATLRSVGDKAIQVLNNDIGGYNHDLRALAAAADYKLKPGMILQFFIPSEPIRISTPSPYQAQFTRLVGRIAALEKTFGRNPSAQTAATLAAALQPLEVEVTTDRWPASARPDAQALGAALGQFIAALYSDNSVAGNADIQTVLSRAADLRVALHMGPVPGS